MLPALRPLVIVCVAAILMGVATAATIETVVGGGFVDNVPATSGTLNGPSGLALDGAGNLYIADVYNNRVRKLDKTTGTLTTVAGSANTGFAGDGGPGTQASLNAPNGLALDPAGSVLYIADSGNNVVRALDLKTQIITTVAGNTKPDFAGDGGPATSAALNFPIFVAVDKSGNLYIADSDNARIRKVTPAGTISTVAGSGNFGFAGDGGPATSATVDVFGGITVDASGNLYICSGRAADLSGNVIRKVDTSGTISTICGTGVSGFSGDGGPAKNAQISYPLDIITDAAGNIYFADNSNHVIRRIDTAGTITTVVGTPLPNSTGGFSGDGGPANKAQFSNPHSLVRNAAGDIYVADAGNNRVRLVTASTGIVQTVAGVAGSGDGGPAIAATLNRVRGCAVDANGNLYVTDYNNSKVRRIDAATGVIQTIAGSGSSGFSGDGGPAISAVLSYPIGIIVDRNGDVVFVDSGNNRVRKIALATNTITTIAGNGTFATSGDGGKATSAGLAGPLFVAVDSKNQYYIADYTGNVIRKVDTSGNISTIAGTGTAGYSGDGGPATAAQLNQPDGIALDPSDNIFFADYANNVVRRIDAATGKITTVAGSGDPNGFRVLDGQPATSGTLFHPADVTVNSTYVYINERDHSAVRTVSLSTGFIGPFAGTGINGFLGDHGPPTAARLSTLDAITQDASGSIYICDLFRVRKISDAGTKLIDVAPFPTRPGIITNFSTTFTAPGAATYSWDFGDGTAGTGPALTHAYSNSGQFIVTLVTSNGNTGATFSREVLVLAPSDNGGLVGNVATQITPPKVPGRESISVQSALGGALEFSVDASNVAGDKTVLISTIATTVTVTSSAAQTRGVASRDDAGFIEPRTGVSFVTKFPAPGLYVVEAKHFGSDNSVTGHGRKTVALSAAELGIPLGFTDDRANTKIAVTALKGTFQFNNTAKVGDAVTVKATFPLPATLDTTKPQTLSIGMGNILDQVTIDAKGKASNSVTGNLKALKVAYKKGKTGKTATVMATFSQKGLVTAGFDTEGISARETDLSAKKTAPRKIQMQIVFAGLSYETQANVTFQYKPNKRGDTGTLNFNRNGN